MAYQGIAGGLGREWVDALDKLTTGGLRPDLTLILDIPVEEGLARASARGGDDRFERQGTQFHETLRNAFLSIAEEAPSRCVVINASQDADSVEDAIWDAVRERLLDTSEARN